MMARIVRPKVNTDGIYHSVRQYLECDLAAWEANGAMAHRQGAPYPRQRILDDLRAARAVNVPTYSLPPSGLIGAPTRPGPTVLRGPRRGCPQPTYPARAIVRPNDTITYTDDNWPALWLEENSTT